MDTIQPQLSRSELQEIIDSLAFTRRCKARKLEKAIRSAAYLLQGRPASLRNLEDLEEIDVHPSITDLMDHLDHLKHLEERLHNALAGAAS